jgi:hypothetical protein
MITTNSPEPGHYVPPVERLLSLAGIGPGGMRAESVTIPTRFFKFLIQQLLARFPFDENSYLESNPDVAAAVAAGRVASGWDHFISTGYFEGRCPGLLPIDEDWYASEYPDVMSGIDDGSIDDVSEHYSLFGYRHGKVGAPDQARMRDMIEYAAAGET